MKKRVFIIHGWAGTPDRDWLSWLKKELEKRNFDVIVPLMPETDNPKIEKWIPTFSNFLKNPDRNTYFVGHSMGCQAIARYLETLPKSVKIGGVVFVAGFFKRLTGLNDEEKAIADPWIISSIDLDKVKSHIVKSIAIFSDNDPFVTPDNQDDYKNKLGSKIIIEHNKEHFNMSKLPIVLKAVLEISK